MDPQSGRHRGLRGTPSCFQCGVVRTRIPKVQGRARQGTRFQDSARGGGNIDFNREMSVDVFAPFPGKIITLFARAGDDVQKGATLFTIDSPDLLQAESTLVSAGGTLTSPRARLERAKQLYEVQGVAQKDLDQAIAEQQSAEGALKAARDSVRIFGKSDAEMDRIVAERKIDSALAVHSPITGRSRLAMPLRACSCSRAIRRRRTRCRTYRPCGCSPALPRRIFPLLQLGQDVAVDVKAYAGRLFRGKIVNIGHRWIRTRDGFWSARKSRIPRTSCGPGCLRRS